METLIRQLCGSQALAVLVGKAPAFLDAIKNLPAVARSDVTTLISGETGTGKELVARAIHYLSDRAPFPFVPVNCGSLPDTLLEDELFGHERGAFTSAHAARGGLIAHAEKGTLFLDEVDTLPAKAQVDLLRVLQDKRFRPIGSSVEQAVDVRIVAATNAPLERMVRSGHFRADLFFRLRIFSIALPLLRDRKEDILLLAAHFVHKHTPAGKARLKLAPEACEALLSHDWPGNVRELENAIIRGIHLCEAECIQSGDLGLQASQDHHTPMAPTTRDLDKLRPLGTMKREVLQSFERRYLTQLMSRHQGNVSQAARAAGKERRSLGKLLKKHNLDSKMFRPAS